MSRKKIILLAVAVVAGGLGLALALVLGSHGAAAHDRGSHPAVLVGALLPLWSAVIAARARKRRAACRRDEE